LHTSLLKRAVVSSALSLSLLLMPVAAAAQDEGSVYVQCDGRPNSKSALGTIARLIALSAVVGLLLPPEEAADPAKRKTGEAGIAACDAALNGNDQAKDGGRRIELFLARAIHKMEVGRWDDAIADLRASEADQPELVATNAYYNSLGQTVRFLEASALAGKQDFAGARAKALEAAEHAPYDVRFMLRAIDYTRMVPTWDAQTEAYYDQFVRIFPSGLIDRAGAKAIAGDTLGAATDFEHRRDVDLTMPDWVGYNWEAQAAVGLALADDSQAAEVLLRRAQAAADADRDNADHSRERAAVTEVSDFMAILSRLNAGEAATARTLFAARSKWADVPAGYVMELSRRLDEASSDEMRSAMPIKSAGEILNEHLDWARTLVTDTGEGSRDLWSFFRQPIEQKLFDKFAGNTWRADKSRYFASEPAKNWNGTLVDVSRNGDGLPSAYAFYLHTALVAKARGHKHFMVLPSQRALFAHYVRLGDPGDADIVAPVLFEADKVIADLSPFIPQPAQRRRN
jgi:hypothetical protein